MIDTEALRKKVIDLAIQGKLTQQLPEDGNAEDLYVQIQEEKNEILKVRGGRQDKSIKTEDDVKPFEIPSNWKWMRFGEVGLFKKGPFGSALTKSMFVPKSENAIKVYEQQHAIKKDAKLGTYYISHEYFEANMTGFEVKAGDIIVSCAGTIGETYTMPTQMEQGIINQALLRVTLVPSILNEFFLYYFDSNLKTDARNESNGMAIKNIPPFDVMKNWYFPLPPLDEQKRIVKKLNNVLAQIDIIDELQQQYESDREILKEKIIDASIRGMLTEQLPEDGDAEDLFAQIQVEKAKLIKDGKIKKEKPLPEISDDEIPFEIPSNWKWVRWGNIVNVVSARRVHQADWRDEGIPFYRAREIAVLADTGVVNNDLYISEGLYNDFSESGVPQAGDLMVTGVGTLGKTYVVQENDRFYYKDASVLCFENYANVNSDFLKRVMESRLMRSQINSNSGGTTVDTLTMVRMNQYVLPLPPREEQKRISNTINELLSLITE